MSHPSVVEDLLNTPTRKAIWLSGSTRICSDCSFESLNVGDVARKGFIRQQPSKLVIDKKNLSVLHFDLQGVHREMVTIRLPEDIESQLEALTELEHKTKSEIIKSALSEYLEKHIQGRSAYELGKDLFGKYSSDETDLSINYKEKIKQKLNEKYTH